MKQRTVSSAVANLILETAGSFGVDSDALLLSMGPDARVYERLQGRLPLPYYAALFDEAVERCGLPALGCYAGARARISTWGAVGYQAMHARRLGEALDIIAAGWPLITEWSRLAVRRESGHLILSGEINPDAPPLPHYAEDTLLGSLTTNLRKLTQTSIRPLEVHFTYLPSQAKRACEELFAATQRFGQPHPALVFDSEIADLPLVEADEALLHLFRGLVDFEREAFKADGTLAAQVNHLIRANGFRTPAGLGVVSRQLGMSPRTLQRNLADEGTRFHQVAETALRQFCLEKLKDPSLSLEEISYDCGFSAPSAFHRAFKRWMGATPTQFRQNL